MLIQEARERIASLEQRIESFVREEKRTGGIERDAKADEYMLYVQFESGIPNKISLDVRAIARDLRDALDHAVYASAVAISGGDPKRTKFLTADTEEGIKDDIGRGRCRDVHPDIVALMIAEGAHQAGNRTLWALNQFRNQNTHKAVTLAALDSGGLGIQSANIRYLRWQGMSEWRSTTRCLYFLRFTGDSKFDLQVDPMVEIRLHESLGLAGEAAGLALLKIAAEVERVVDAIQTETARILRERGG